MDRSSTELSLGFERGPLPGQGTAGGPPISQWTFDSTMTRLLLQMQREYAIAGPVETEPALLYCTCRGANTNNSKIMIQCSNESECGYEWFHAECLDLKTLPARDEEWYCQRCIRLGIGNVGEWSHIFSSAPMTRRLRIIPPPLDPSIKFEKVSPSTAPSTSPDIPLIIQWEARFPVHSKRNVPASTRNDCRTVSDCVPQTVTPKTTPRSDGKTSWNVREEEILIDTITDLKSNGMTDTEHRWEVASKELEGRGFVRTPTACRMVWMRYLRERSGIDERVKGRSVTMKTGVQVNRKRSKRTSTSPIKIPKRQKVSSLTGGKGRKLKRIA
ncbi:hypothetical protein MMC12_005941 [Toensbergia leucococca]|nr:hypothetical protein [Toensbergia leucococca]